jgi:hypothetical protein
MAGDEGIAALAEHAHGAWRRRVRSTTGSGGNYSRWDGWQRTSHGRFLLSTGDGGAVRDGRWRRGMDAEVRRIGTVGQPHNAVNPSTEWERRASTRI